MPERLLVYQALWAMDQLAGPPASVSEKFDRVKQAGFDGMTIDLGALSMRQARATIPEFRRTGLRSGLTAFPKTVEELRPALALAQEIQAPFVVVIGQEMPLDFTAMTASIRGWLAVAADEGVPIQFETHRNCITNDLYTTVQLLDAVPEMRLSADLSHYVVDREMPCPPTVFLQELVTRVLESSESFQGRVASRSQIQIALTFEQNQKWVELFKAWWKQGFEAWAKRHRDDDMPLVFLCELGPPDYAITNCAGEELSDRWHEASLLAEWARSIWTNSHSA